jgi:hypothetical protein
MDYLVQTIKRVKGGFYVSTAHNFGFLKISGLTVRGLTSSESE